MADHAGEIKHGQHDNMEIERETLPWRDGWLINPPAGLIPAESPCRPGFRLGSTPGELAPNIASAMWRLRIELPPRTGCLAHGFVATDAASQTFHHVFSPAPATLCGETGGNIVISLSASKIPVRRDGNVSIIESPGLCVVLITAMERGITRWALVWSSGNEHETLVHAKAALSISAKSAWDEIIALRREILARIECDDEHRPAVIEAIETLIGAVRPADGAFPGMWLDTRNESPAMDLSRALAILPALGQIAPAAAGTIIGTILQLREPDNSLPAFVAPDRSAGQRFAPLPMLAQTALALWRGNPEMDFPPRIVPRLVQILQRQYEYFESMPGGILRWKHPAESLTPEIFDTGLATPDATSLFLAELDALRELAAPFPAFEPSVAPILARRNQLEKALQEFFLDEKKTSFQNRYLDGRVVTRVTAACAMPLLAARLTPGQQDQIVANIAAGGPLRHQGVIEGWVRWQNDHEPPPAPALIQILMLRALRRNNLNDEAGTLARDIFTTIVESRKKTGHLPHDLCSAREQALLPLETAALVLHLVLGDELETLRPRHRVSPFLNWLDKQRNGIAIAAIIIAIGTGAIFAWPLIFPRGDAAAETKIGIAQMHYDQGDFHGAIAMYEELLNSPLRDAQAVDFHLGNAWFRLGGWSQAESAYRAGLNRNPDQPRAWMNLALSLFKQRKIDEAEKIYRDFIAKFGSYYPELAARAETALQLCEEQRQK